MIPVKKRVSGKIPKQITGTCWAFSISTTILKMFKNIIPEDLEYITESDVCDDKYEEANFDNLDGITPENCGQIDYNNIILFKYIYIQF